MYKPDHPICNSLGYMQCGAMLGSSPAGYFKNFYVEPDDRNENYIISYDVVNYHGNIDDTDWRIYIYSNGTYFDSTKAETYIFSMGDITKDTWRLDFFLLPDGTAEGVELPDWSDALILYNCITLNWSNDGRTNKVEVYKTDDASGDIDLDNPIMTYTEPVIQIEGIENISVSGVWAGDDVKYGVINCFISHDGYATGETGRAAAVHWTYGTDTGVLYLADYYQELINGVRIKADSDSTYFTYNDSFQIIAKLPTTYSTSSRSQLSNGVHQFQVGTFNQSNLRTLSSSVSVEVLNVPGAPYKNSSSYVDGSGTVQIVYYYSDPDASKYYIYRNYPAENQLSIDPIPCDWGTCYPGSYITVTLRNLTAGVNRIISRLYNSSGIGEENFYESLVEIVLDANLNQITIPNYPESLSATVNADETVTIKVFADTTSDVINIYRNTGVDGDAVNYSNIFTAITNPQYGLSVPITQNEYFADGTWTIAARAKRNAGNVEEDNDFRQHTFIVDRNAAPAATGLTATASESCSV